MTSKGFRESVEARIELIRDNLRDRYHSGFPILKELLANADDAGATVLHLGWAQGIEGASHPLLNRPALFAVNDGVFRSQDEDGIHSLGLGSRGGDIATIGRFGLGLKSVFHLCDSLFYLASGLDGDASQPIADVLNPWSHETRGKHRDWDALSANDAQRLRGVLEPCCRSTHWLAIWLPLRSSADPKPWIMEEFLGELDAPPPRLLSPSTPVDIAKVIPLLANVRTVRLWRAGAETETLMPSGGCELAVDGNRRRPDGYPEVVRHPGSLRGTVVVTNTGAPAMSLAFSGLERRLDGGAADSLRSHPKWPKRPVLDLETDEWTDRPEKATPHAAAQFLRSPASPGTAGLRVCWACYLPVGEPDPADCVRLAGPFSWDLILHGCLFVDAGRRRIDFAAPSELDTERAVRCAWNAALRCEAILPLVIPSLDRAVQELGPGHFDAVEDLTRALDVADSLRKSDARSALCRDAQWCVVLGPSGRRWEAVPAVEALLALELTQSWEWSAAAFPALGQVAANWRLTPARGPRLTLRAPVSAWPESACRELLRVPDDHATAPIDELRFRLDTVVRVIERPVAANLVAELRAFLLPLLLHRRASDLQELLPSLCRILELLPADSIVGLPVSVRSASLQEVLGFLHDAEPATCRLYVPQEFLSEPTPNRVQLGVATVVQLLTSVAKASDRAKGMPAFRAVLAHLIEVCSDPDAVIEDTLDLRLVRDERSEVSRLWTFRELRDLAAQGRVAISPENVRQWDRAGSSAIAGDLALIDAEVVRVAFASLHLKLCGRDWAVAILLESPRLAEPTLRGDLLKLLLDAVDFSRVEHRLAVRYLLHGHADRVADDADLLESGTQDALTVWRRLTEQILAATGEQWRVLSRELLELLTPSAKRAIGVASVDASSVERLLRGIAPSAVDWTGLSHEDRRELVLHLEDNAILKSLPIHERVDGRLVPIGAATFLESDWCRRAPSLASQVSILRRPPEHDTKAGGRLAKLVPEFDGVAVIETALSRPDPASHWSAICDAGAEALSSKSMRDDLKASLQSVAWLPCERGTVAPRDVVSLPHDAATVALSLLDGATQLRPRESLAADVRDSESFRACQESLIPGIEAQLQRLGSILSGCEQCHVGSVVIDDMDQFERWLNAFDNRDSDGAMPVATFLSRFKREEHRRFCLRHVLRPLSKALPAHRLARVLSHLGQRVADAPRNEREPLWHLFLEYLEQLPTAANPAGLLPGLLLPSQDGKWRRPTELCVDAHGVSPAALLDSECSGILRTVIASSSVQHSTSDPGDDVLAPLLDESVERHVAESPSILESYFAPWVSVADEEFLGAFLALLGDEPGVRRLACHHLDPTRLVVFLNSLDWSADGGAVGLDETIEQTLAKQRFVVSAFDSDSVRVTSLLGSPFQAPLDRAVRTLLVGDRRPQFLVGRLGEGRARVYKLRLRRTEPSALGRERCNEILRETARALLSEMYWRTVPNFDEKWQGLGRADQIDLDFTRDWLLEQAPIYLEQLGLRTHPRLGPLLHRLKEAERRVFLEQRERVPEARRRGSDEQRAAMEELAGLLTGDADTHAAVLGAVRRKVGTDAQYDPDSAPFELLQNADDAATELGTLFRPERPLASQATRWEMHIRDDGLALVHHGRCVNQYLLGEFDGSDLGFRQDLEKMLVLQASDKQLGVQAACLTGKFGLGFKSSFLVSNEPVVWSGRLRCRIVGGFLPVRDEESPGWMERLIRPADTATRPTIIYLPPRADISLNHVAGRFADLAPIQMVFTRALRHGTILSGGEICEVRWDPQALGAGGRLTVGALQLKHPDLPSHLRALVLRAGSEPGEPTAVVLLIGTRGVVPFPKSVPTIWATTPTRERLDIGLVLNAPFAVDVGRSQLARDSSGNASLAVRLAAGIRDSLADLAHVCAGNWDSSRVALGLEPDVGADDFWESVFDVTAQMAAGLASAADGAGSTPILATALWGDGESAFTSFVSTHRVVPTRLPSPLHGTTSVSQVRFVVDSWLTQHQDFLVACGKQPSVASRLTPGSAVSAEVWSVLRGAFGTRNVRQVSVSDLVAWVLDDDTRLEPERASDLGGLLDDQFWQQLDGPLGEAAARELARAEFITRAGMFALAKDLLQSDPGTDEGMRAGFAPPERVLSDRYSPAALRLFVRCRGQLQAPSRTLAEWASRARSAPERVSVVAYLLRGELRDELRQEIRQHFPESWVFALRRGSPELADLAEAAQIELLAGLGLITSWGGPAELPGGGPVVEPPPPALDTDRALETIRQWWSRERTARLRQYSNDFYPHCFVPSGLAAWDPAAAESRRAWLIVLLLGAFHSMGRTRAEQHRSFLDLCHRRGWMDRFVLDAKSPGMWGEVLREYFADQTQDNNSLLWMLQLPRIYVIAHWLPDHVEAFLSIARPGPAAEPHDILSTRASARFQGGGPNAPPLTRVLGFGFCFVVRELRRHGVLTRGGIDEHCFVPTRRLRHLLSRLGCDLDTEQGHVSQSRQIFRFLCEYLPDDPTFGDDFDIPLQILAADRALQEGLFAQAIAGGDELEENDDDLW